MPSTTPASSPRAIINCRKVCKAVTGTIDLTGEAARSAYVLGGVWTRCPACGISLMADAVRGTYSATKKCGGACLHAKRGDCECSCAGANHGTGG
jgi:hypothetical protein